MDVTSVAEAQTAQTCVAAFDRGQELQTTLRLREAREQYLACARDGCHPMVRKDCALKLEEISRDLPTITLVARDREGRDLPDVRALVDGVPVERAKFAGAIPLDPGPHAVRFEAEGSAPRSVDVVLRVGEKNRPVSVQFEDLPITKPDSTPEEALPAEHGAGRGPWPWVLAGVSVASFGGFMFFGLTGLSEKNRLLDTCAAACSEGDASRVRNDYIAADILLVVSLLAAGGATYLFLTEPPAPPRKASGRR
jgi:hypothetical protein